MGGRDQTTNRIWYGQLLLLDRLRYRMGRDLFRDFYFRVSFFFRPFATPSIAFCFWVPLRDFFRFNFSASILFLCFSACLLFCFFASLLFCFSAFLFLCFSSFLVLLLLPAFLLLCLFASLLLCFSASLLLCFRSFFASLLLRFFFAFLLFAASLLLGLLLLSFLWCLFYFSTFLFLMCHGKNMGYVPPKNNMS